MYKHVGQLMSLLCMIGILSGAALHASERVIKRYKIAEKLELVETSPYVLTVSSNNLTRYPRSIVTFTVSTASSRSPSALIPAGNDVVPVGRMKGKRHYHQFADGKYGRDGKSYVIFDQKRGTVFLEFVGAVGKIFYYKEITASASEELAQHQMRQ